MVVVPEVFALVLIVAALVVVTVLGVVDAVVGINTLNLILLTGF